jgi:Zn-dependent protease
MSERESWVGRRFADLSPDEQRAFLDAYGEPVRDYHGLDATEGDAPQRDYDPIHPAGTDWRGILRRIWAPIAAAIGLLVKFSFILFKFFSIFIAVGGYALIWGWRFATGFVALILIHELGHFFEARRQGLDVSLPRFIPFLGAYVSIKDSKLNPWKNALVALAGPAAGGVGALSFWVWGEATDSQLMVALAYAGFLLNLINLAPIGILDGGAIWRSIQVARRLPAFGDELAAVAPYGGVPGGGRDRANLILFLYVTLAVLLVVGMIATHVPQHRL